MAVFYFPPWTNLLMLGAMNRVVRFPESYEVFWSDYGYHSSRMTECEERGCPTLDQITAVQDMAAEPASDFYLDYPITNEWSVGPWNGDNTRETPDIPIPFPFGHLAEAGVAAFIMIGCRIAWVLGKYQAQILNDDVFGLGSGGKGGLVRVDE